MVGAGRLAILIPVYNHASRIGAVIEKAKTLDLPVWVIDDGSDDGTAQVLAGQDAITLLRHDQNRGKGAALLTGFVALEGRADWAVSLDADGQHDSRDIPALIKAVPEGQRPLVVGRRQGMDGAHVPWTSRFGRGFSNFWVRCAGGPRLADTQSGLRLYPLPEVLHLGVRARRFQFEVEVLVRAHRAGIPVIETPVGVCYQRPGERVSHFRPWIDFLRNSMVFARLIGERVLRRPRREARRTEQGG